MKAFQLFCRDMDNFKISSGKAVPVVVGGSLY